MNYDEAIDATKKGATMSYADAVREAANGAHIMRKDWQQHHPQGFPFRYLINASWHAKRYQHLWQPNELALIPPDALLEIATDFGSRTWGFWDPDYEHEAVAADDWQIFVVWENATFAFDPNEFYPEDLIWAEDETDDE
jgi:hypothetical protein